MKEKLAGLSSYCGELLNLCWKVRMGIGVIGEKTIPQVVQLKLKEQEKRKSFEPRFRRVWWKLDCFLIFLAAGSVNFPAI